MQPEAPYRTNFNTTADDKPAPGHLRLVQRAKLLAWLGLVWHILEAAVSVIAGLVAGSVALVGFGADSVIEAIAAIIILWRFGGARATSERAEQRAQKAIGASFLAIAVYIAFEAVRDLIIRAEPEASWVGIGLAAVTSVTMPILARQKATVGRALNSEATTSEGQQNMLCAYLSIALLVGLGANALFGLWWADPATALVIAGAALREGIESWRSENCEDCC